MYLHGIAICLSFVKLFLLFFAETKWIDIKHKQIKAREINFYRRKKNWQYYEISAKSNYNLEFPFLFLARKLVNDDNLHFEESPAIAPPEVKFDLDTEKWRETEFLNCIPKLPLPDEDDDLADDIRGFDERTD